MPTIPSSALLASWRSGLADGSIVPDLGPGVLADVSSLVDGRPIPATSEQLILAMNGGRPMAPKLMHEFSRAAMNVELKRGRSAVTRFLDSIYGASHWTRAALHEWLATLRPRYVIDTNRDTQLLDSYAVTPHVLILGCARLGGTDHRFRLYALDGSGYRAIAPTVADTELPLLFKPMGAPLPQPSYVASDADQVDYITELMGGFAVPSFVKVRRRGRRYLLLGVRLDRDTERMILSDLVHDAAVGPAGWALIPEANDKERRLCQRIGIEIVEADALALLAGAATS